MVQIMRTIHQKKYTSWAVSERRRVLKRMAVAYKGGICSRCGYDKCVNALSFHHLDPSQKDFTISGGTTKRWSRIQPELDKCVLLCMNCHVEEHAEQDRLRWEAQEKGIRALVPARVVRPPKTCLHCPTVLSSRKQTFCRVCWEKAREARAQASRSLKALNPLKDLSWPSPEDLARKVWEVPVEKVAQALGVSGPAVHKRCRRLGIRTPPRGYWQKLASSQQLLFSD